MPRISKLQCSRRKSLEIAREKNILRAKLRKQEQLKNFYEDRRVLATNRELLETGERLLRQIAVLEKQNEMLVGENIRLRRFMGSFDYSSISPFLLQNASNCTEKKLLEENSELRQLLGQIDPNKLTSFLLKKANIRIEKLTENGEQLKEVKVEQVVKDVKTEEPGIL